MNRHFYELQFEIENSCALNCVHCSSAELRKNGSIEYSISDLLRFVSIFQNGAYIYFTGGEPLLNNDLLQIANKIRSNNQNARVGLYTTGNLYYHTPITSLLALEMESAGINDCYFSLYSDIASEHDSWTTVHNSFENTVISIQNLLTTKIVPKVHLVLNRHNKNKIEEVIDFCRNIGVKEVRILRLVSSGSAKDNWEQIGIPLSEQNEIIHNLIRKQNGHALRITYSGYPKLYPCRPFPDSIGCQAGTHLLYIDANGDVFPCACTKSNSEKFRIGHISEIERIKEYITSHENIQFNNDCLNAN